MSLHTASQLQLVWSCGGAVAAMATNSLLGRVQQATARVLGQPSEAVVAAPVGQPVVPDVAARRRAGAFRTRLWRLRRCLADVRARGPCQPSSCFDGILNFFDRDKGAKRVNWETVVRVGFSDGLASAQAIRDLALGGEVSCTTIRRIRIRVAEALNQSCRLRALVGLRYLSGACGVASTETSSVVDLTTNPQMPVVLVGLLWKWDETDVRWRTTSTVGDVASSSSSLVQRGWLFLRQANGKTVRVPIPVPTVPLPSKKPEDLWHNLHMLLWTRSRLCRDLALRMPVLLVFVSDAASTNRSMVAHEIAGMSPNMFVVHVLCVAHQLHLCARSQFAGLGPHFVAELSRASRVFQVGSYHHRLLQSVDNVLCAELQIVLPGDDAFHPEDSGHHAQLLLFLVRSVRGRVAPHLLQACETVVRILNGSWSQDLPVRCP